MPLHCEKDSYGTYFQFGNKKKYYFDPRSRVSEEEAYQAARRQGQAINVSKNERINKK
jgi:hypothetical protein